MAFRSALPLAIIVSLSLIIPSALAGVICEDLPKDLCSFAVSSLSRRCVLESYAQSGKPTVYECQTSEVVVERIKDHVETNQCVKACGVDRNSVGISSDSLLEPQFAGKLCSPECHQSCPNIIDLYFNLAAGEGVFLPDLCQAHRSNPRRAMAELMSSGVLLPFPPLKNLLERESSSAALSPHDIPPLSISSTLSPSPPNQSSPHSQKPVLAFHQITKYPRRRRNTGCSRSPLSPLDLTYCHPRSRGKQGSTRSRTG